MNNCGRCGQTVADLYLCATCTASTIRALSIFAPIVADLRSMMTDLRATPSDSVRVDGTRDRKLGADFDLADRSHALYATIANWCVGWALAFEIPAPGDLGRYGRENAVTRLPQGDYPFLAASRVATWLTAHHSERWADEYTLLPGIDQNPDAGIYATEIIDAITAEAHAIGYRPRPRKVPARRCRVCDSATLRHIWPLNGEPRLTCTACGEEHPCGPNLTRAVLQAR